MKNKIKKLVGGKVISKFKKVLESFDMVLVRIMSKNSALASFYYFLFSNEFNRENKSVLKGRLKYHDSVVQMNDTRIMLRRNIHRLEKGLIMRPRRDIFATAYISETVDAFDIVLQKELLKTSEFKWCVSVLKEYFSIVGNNPTIDKAKEKFNQNCKDINFKNSENLSSKPYLRKDIQLSSITDKQLEELFVQRRSTRWYLDQKVSLNLVERAVEMARLAPSACNRQPFKFHVIDNKEKVKEVADYAMGTVGFSHNFPMIIAVVGDLSAYPSERDRHVIYIDGSLIAMQLSLAFETLGLSSCIINWPDIEFREKKLDSSLKLNSYERPIMLISVGYADPDGGIPFSHKKDVSELIKVVSNDC